MVVKYSIINYLGVEIKFYSVVVLSVFCWLFKVFSLGVLGVLDI